MTTRIVTFDDGVTTETVPSTATTTGPVGPAGTTGASGDAGPSGPAGDAATIVVGTVTTGVPGTSAEVSNTGNTSAAVFDFTIPTGASGSTGQPGFNAPSAISALEINWNDSTFYTKSISVNSTFTFANVDATTNNGKVIMIVVNNTDTSNARTLTWPNNVNASSSYVMPADSTSIFTFINNANTFYGFGRIVL